MNNLTSTSYYSVMLNRGFTLIELVIVMLILAILSVTVVPKFFTSSGFSEFAYRADAIAKLRLIQTKAMQQTGGNDSDCHQVFVTSKKLGAPKDCDSSKGVASTIATGLEVASKDDVSFTTDFVGNTFTFDSMGRPNGCGPCNITIAGEQTIVIRIEAEGYIHGL